ncbi:MAG: GNAT family N-acetyltransferase [Streptococcus parasanguinis]
MLAEQAGDAVAYLLATEDQPLKGNLIVFRLAVRPAFQGQGYGSILIVALEGSSCSKGKGSHSDQLPRRLTILFFLSKDFRDEAESDRGVRMVWER